MERDYSGLARWALQAVTSKVCLLEESRRGFDYREKRKRQCDHGSRYWSDVAISQGMSIATRRWERQGTDSSLGLWRKLAPKFLLS